MPFATLHHSPAYDAVVFTGGIGEHAAGRPPRKVPDHPADGLDNGLSSGRLLPSLVRNGSVSHLVLNGSGFQIFGYFGQLGGPDSELFDNFRFDRHLPQIATSPCEIPKVVCVVH